MELSELTAYAGEKFHIREEHKWADFPGFSVLANPGTGKWAALLMRQWDSDTGTELQRCDIKCGQLRPSERSAPYLSPPFRMKGKKWVGVRLEAVANPEDVFRLFDRAVYAGEAQGYTMVLEDAPVEKTVLEPDLPPPSGSTRIPGSAGIPVRTQATGSAQFSGRTQFHSRTQIPGSIPDIPDRIREMLRLYRYEGNSLEDKCRNFYRQGKFMENYEDDVPWTGAYRHYFPVYHDLNIPQLRGYFTWRTGVRKGIFSPVPASLAYIYLYELLNGIGAESPEDSLRKMQEFESGFLDSGIGDPGMRRNLRRWMFEYAVIHEIPPEQARRYADPAARKSDDSLTVLVNPEAFSDEEIFSALCVFAGKKLEQTPVIRKDAERGKRLFAEVWRRASKARSRNSDSFFTACFGKQNLYPWRPLANAVYWNRHVHPDTDYILDGCRAYLCRGGSWWEIRYDSLYFDRKRFRGLMHEADRRLRKYLKTGHYLHENPEESWAAVYVEAVINAERQAEIEAARPKITIDFSSLEQIRQDALATRDSLLTEEEKAESQGEDAQTENPEKETVLSLQERMTPGTTSQDPPYGEILQALLRGESPDAYIKAGHLIPSVVADSINEAFFDEIGDSILECDSDTITVVEDYREDVLQLLGGKNG